jgi:hypothetical protein
MEYTFIRNGVEEKVEKEKWCWVCAYNDSTILKQFDDDGFFHQFGEIDQSKLLYFHLISDEGKTKTLMFKQGMKLIHFYRNVVLENGQIRLRMTVFGYERAGEKVLLVVMPNDEIILTDDLDNISFDSGGTNE